MAIELNIMKFPWLRQYPYLWKDLLFFTLGITIVYRLFLSSYALIAPDEARYCEIAREMLVHHNFIVPRLNDLLYFEKPPFFYWIQSLAIYLFGLHEWALRIGSVCFGVIGGLATYVFANRFYDRRAAIYSSLILTSSLLYFGLAHYASIDMTVSVLIAITLISALFGLLEKQTKKRMGWIALAACFSALAVLTKGLIGIVFPGLILLLWLLLTQQGRLIRRWDIPLAVVVFLIIALPWHVVLQLQYPQFFHFYFIQQQFSRYASLSASRYEPFYFYSVVMLLGFFPWSAFLVQAMRHAWVLKDNRSVDLFLFIWFFTIFIFFSFSQSQLIPYILPVFIPAAILTGRYLATFETKRTTGLNVGAFIVLFLIAVLAAYLFIAPYFYPLSNPHQAQFWFILLTVILVATALLFFCLFWRSRLKAAFLVLLVGTFLFEVSLLHTIPYVDHQSIKPLAMQLRTLKKPSDRIVNYKHYNQDLPFYLRQKVIVADCTNELDFGVKFAPFASWMISNQAFWKLWGSNQRVFAVTRIDDYSDMKKAHPSIRFYVIGQTQRNILLCNRAVVIH